MESPVRGSMVGKVVTSVVSAVHLAEGSLTASLSPLRNDVAIASLDYRQSLDQALLSLVEQQKLEMLCMTWNVNQQKPHGSSPFFGIVSKLASSAAIKLAIFGLQEIEMGSHSVAMAAAKDKINKKAQVLAAIHFYLSLTASW